MSKIVGSAGGEEHRRLIEIALQGRENSGRVLFRKTALDLAGVEGMTSEELFDDIRPDGWYITYDEEGWATIHAIEVEISNPMDGDKLDKYAWAWFSLDAYFVDLTLTAITRYGASHDIDLQALYFAGAKAHKFCLPMSIDEMAAELEAP